MSGQTLSAKHPPAGNPIPQTAQTDRHPALGVRTIRPEAHAMPHDARIEPVTDPGDPRVAPYMNVKDAWLRHQAGLDPGGSFMAEGRLVVGQLLRSRYRPRSLLIAPKHLETMQAAGELDAWPSGAPIYLAEKAVLDAITGIELHRGILALADRGPEPNAGVVLASCASAVVLEDLSNHDNVGGIFRSVAALAGVSAGEGPGGGAVLMNARTCDPLYRKAIRVSMGTALRVAWARVEPWPHKLQMLSEKGFVTLALTPGAGSVSLSEAVRRFGPEGSELGGRRVALLVGAEGPGLTDRAMASADARVRIPIDTRVDSLNVTVAASIALAALVRPPGA